MNFKYERKNVTGDFNFSSTQLMSLSTQKYRTQVFLDDCVVNNPPEQKATCGFENSQISSWDPEKSSTNLKAGFKNSEYTLSQYSPQVQVVGQQLEDTIAFPYTSYDQVSFFYNLNYVGIISATLSTATSGVTYIYKTAYNGVIGLEPITTEQTASET